jgi:hypothetical protein
VSEIISGFLCHPLTLTGLRELQWEKPNAALAEAELLSVPETAALRAALDHTADLLRVGPLIGVERCSAESGAWRRDEFFSRHADAREHAPNAALINLGTARAGLRLARGPGETALALTIEPGRGLVFPINHLYRALDGGAGIVLVRGYFTCEARETGDA